MKKDYKTVHRHLSRIRQSERDVVQSYMAAKMVADNIAHLVQPGFKIRVDESVRFDAFNHKFPPTIQMWDRQLEILSRYLNKEPYKSIDQYSAYAYFHLSISNVWMNKQRYGRYIYVDVYVKTDNSEKCEIFMQKELIERPVATGYCAEIQKRKYLVKTA